MQKIILKNRHRENLHNISINTVLMFHTTDTGHTGHTRYFCYGI